MDIEELIKALPVEKKIRMLSGKDFWRTQDYEEFGIDSFEVADGPYGVRKQMGLCDHMGWNKSVPATAYVSGPGLASSFDTDLAHETGKHLASEARALGVDILLGPAVNIVRTPLCGRNFEYYSEDPFLSGKIAAAYINGCQSQGVGTCIKHYAANNQEVDREYIDAEIDERALREIYLKVFEIANEESHPWAVMTALNKVNGEYCSENSVLIKDILRGEWAYDGLVMSDWSGVNNRERALRAGLDLEMPYSFGVSEKRLLSSYMNNTLPLAVIDEGVRHILKTLEKVLKGREIMPEYTGLDHNAFVRTMAEKTAVLLKNDDGILPLDKSDKLLVCGNFAINPRFKMEGSALVNPTSFDIPLDEIKKIAREDVFFETCYNEENEIDAESLSRAEDLAKRVDKVILFIGLPNGIEAEGKDRKDIFIPASYVKVLEHLKRANKNIVAVLLNGSPIDTSWDKSAKAILEMFLAGQSLGSAVANLLYGNATPGGKLPVSFPCALEQTPAYLNYPGYSGKVEYREGVFVGYRYYLTKKIDVKYPFGFGLSYTDFDIRLVDKEINGNNISFDLEVANIGAFDGSEVVQVYVEPPKGRVPRALRELKAFKRIYLKKGEKKLVSFALNEKDFAYYDEKMHSWYAPKGTYSVAISTDCTNTKIAMAIDITPLKGQHSEITGWSTVGALRESEAGRAAIERIKQLLSESDNEQAHKFPLLQRNGESDDQVDKIPLRMVTVLTDNTINNDIMDELIETVNNQNLEKYR